MLVWWMRCKRFLKSEEGPTAVEYAIMLALIILVCVAAVTVLGSKVNEKFGETRDSMGT